MHKEERMSILDNVTIFGKDVLASNATTFDVIDLGLTTRNIAGNRHGAGYLNVHVNTNMNSAATTIQLYEGNAANAVNSAVAGTAITLTNAVAGDQFTVKLPKTLKRYVSVQVSAVNTGKIDAFIGAPLADH